jgi:site-specific recombinase XerD
MLEQYFSQGQVIGRYREGPLGSYADEFVRWLNSQGYARPTVRVCVEVLGHFSHWLQRRALEARQVSDDLVGHFLRRSGRTDSREHHERAALGRILEYLRRMDIAVHREVAPKVDPIGVMVEDFERYLLHDRALSQVTLSSYGPHVHLFLSACFGTGPLELDKLSVRHVQKFVLERSRNRAPKSTQLMLSALRSFLRFLFLRGKITVELADHVPTVAFWRQPEPPKWLPAEDIKRVLNSCDRHSACGQRNYAILLLLARLGLRAGEIVSLKLEDIRWETAEISVCGKGAHRKRFPLPEEVGVAIAAYLKNGRPRCDSRRVFLRTLAPIRGFARSSTVDAVVSRAVRRAGLNPPLKGAHLFRHSLATSMLRHGATLTEIGQILHHANPDTTSIYAKVDIAGLRALAMPWPGEHP